MLKLESLHIEELRGIRKLDLSFQGGKSFAISGANGSGKSGIIDAIEFALTGQITRLSGQGTKDLSVAKHGPHVDATQSPHSAFVQIKLALTRIKKSVTLTRHIASPTKPTVEPPDADVLSELDIIAQHPEIAISRREILRFVIAESSKRSEEVQALLKLDQVGEIRKNFQSVKNKLKAQHSAATQHLHTVTANLQRHLQTPDLADTAILAAINPRRVTLGLPPISELTPTGKLDAGLSAAVTAKPSFNKASALRDLQAFTVTATAFPASTSAEIGVILSDLDRLQTDPPLRAALQTRALLEQGFDLLDGRDCPLCDTRWPNDRTLRDHLNLKLAQSEQARQLLERLLQNAAAFAQKAAALLPLAATAQKLAQHQRADQLTQQLTSWTNTLRDSQGKLTSWQGLLECKDQLASLNAPPELLLNLQNLIQTISDLPDQSVLFEPRLSYPPRNPAAPTINPLSKLANLPKRPPRERSWPTPPTSTPWKANSTPSTKTSRPISAPSTGPSTAKTKLTSLPNSPPAPASSISKSTSTAATPSLPPPITAKATRTASVFVSIWLYENTNSAPTSHSPCSMTFSPPSISTTAANSVLYCVISSRIPNSSSRPTTKCGRNRWPPPVW
jgi:energy-coupling factor transporter ATP-binding protein EcfA2